MKTDFGIFEPITIALALLYLVSEFLFRKYIDTELINANLKNLRSVLAWFWLTLLVRKDFHHLGYKPLFITLSLFAISCLAYYLTEQLTLIEYDGKKLHRGLWFSGSYKSRLKKQGGSLEEALKDSNGKINLIFSDCSLNATQVMLALLYFLQTTFAFFSVTFLGDIIASDFL